MSSHNYPAVPPPPPPPPPATAPRHGQPISPGRAAAVRPGIITQGIAFAQTHGNLQTPASATSLGPFSPFANNTPSPYAPSPVASSPMAAPYNPQQWRGGNARPGVQYAPAQTQMSINPARAQDVSGHEEAMPSPPPPYTPAQAQSQTISQALGSSPGHAFAQNHPPPPPIPQTSTPTGARAARGFHSRPVSIAIPSGSAAAPVNTQFAPPPMALGRERSSSRGLSTKFSLSSFRNRNNDHSPAPSAIESLHMSTHDALQRGDPGPASQRNFAQYTPSPLDRRWIPADTQSPIRPPNSRRAASAGVLGHGTETRTPIDETPPSLQSSWGPGMPLPPPPPGPPPSSSRSQSVGLSYDSDCSSGYPSAPPTRRPGASTLGPIPPTPMGWEDELAQAPTPAPGPPSARSPAAHGLYVDTSLQTGRHQEYVAPPPETESESTVSGPSMTSHSGSGSTLSQSRREGSTRGSIRERREESRAARERYAEPSNNPWAHDLEISTAKPANLDLASPEGGLSRRGAITRNTPRSGGALRSPRSAHLYDEPGSANSTPRIITGPRVASGAAPTPPFSPGTEHLSQKAPATFPAKALPTPPPHSAEDERALTTPSGVAYRSVSQTSLHSASTPHDPSLRTPKPTDRDAFAQASIERHRAFIEKEMHAENDEERLKLFAEFIVAESRFRRDQYSGAFDAMAGEVMDLTRDLWRSNKTSGRRAITPSAQVTPSYSRSKRSGSVSGESPETRPSEPTTAASPASSRGQFTPHTEPASPASVSSQRARDASWANNYHPSLSPIPSMTMSTIPDEEDSRGRSASRWWESDDGSQGVGGRRLERSKRESKYMGLVMETQESFHRDGQNQPIPKHYRASSSSRPAAYGANEYPPEKVGSHDSKGKQPASYDYFPTPTPPAVDPHKLDVSRLVTLPPPYPRHHPAVNNNHPDLASIRNSLRTLTDFGDVKITKANFQTKMEARKESENALLNTRRAEIRYNIQENLRNGQMSFQDAAKADAEFEAREHQRAQDVVQNTFDTFQAEVANTLHAMFCERITKVTASIEHLKGRLSTEAQELNPNQTQEEGDEKPELLEMLTLLKWLFELREQLHKELFELENERNDLYRDIIVLPYIQAKNDQKVKEATDFFRRDAQDRKVTFEKETLKRYEEFMEVIERNVTRGVETQLSAFWDIAPGLLAIVQKVPHRLDGFDILIPAQEYSENPAYHDFPLQYLYTLLAHAGRSAYQFIESQINLLCLLHEVKTAVMTAGSRLLETQRLLEGEDLASVDLEMKAIRADEEQRLTDDLKEKVGLVESQWNEALGQGLKECKTKVEEFLTEQGGWDDSLSE